MKLYFSECDYGEDFESIESPPESWNIGGAEPGDPFLWFKAYDTSLCECEMDALLHEYGFGFNCCVWLEFEYMGRREYLMDGVPAKDRTEAERLLQAAADALYGEE